MCITLLFRLCILCIAQNELPKIEINTEDSSPIESKEEYINAEIVIDAYPYYEIIVDSCKIRGRGNATWNDYPKKPYKIKLYNKHSLFGFPANKDWVLLAEYCDKTLVRTAFMCEVSKAVGLDYTVNYQHVELILNGEYQGIYVLTDQVEKANNRVDIEDDGFIIEDDNYYDKEPLYFTSSFGNKFTFKYPDADKRNIELDDDNYTFIKNFINNLENALLAIPMDCESYRKYIDVKSFAKWYIVNEVLGNWEPNLYYVLPTRGSKLKMLPVWDAEWSLGLACKGNELRPDGWYLYPYESPWDIDVWKRKYFQYLFKDPVFVSDVCNIWQSFVKNIKSVKDVIRLKLQEIQIAQKDNFTKWPVLGEIIAVTLVAFPTWEEEVEYMFSYFDNRVLRMSEELGEYTGIISLRRLPVLNNRVYSINGQKIENSNSVHPVIIENGMKYANKK